uniref:Uncharacterized protein n=1 Tax=Arundo donax TaxID=35708 RepID=A0A0A9E299_ARUDO
MSPPCTINPLITRWKHEPLKWSGLPLAAPTPFSPVQSARKFSAVRGTTEA